MVPAKVCTVCQIEKPVNQFYRQKRGFLGVKSICKPCDNKQASDRYYRNHEANKAKRAEWRKTHRQYGRDNSAKWYAANKERRLAKAAEWSRANPDHHRALKKTWRLENSARVNAHSAKYRALKFNATPPWLSAIDEALIQEMYDVAIAKTTQTGIEHHVDHIHPIQGDGFNGLHVPWNLRVITAYENRVKLNKLPVEEAHLAWGV